MKAALLVEQFQQLALAFWVFKQGTTRYAVVQYFATDASQILRQFCSL
jgi:hypothetical protein